MYVGNVSREPDNYDDNDDNDNDEEETKSKKVRRGERKLKAEAHVERVRDNPGLGHHHPIMIARVSTIVLSTRYPGCHS